MSKDKENPPEAELFQIPAKETIRLDGRLNEPCWSQAKSIGPLTMVVPEEGGLPTQKTDIRIVANINTIYIGIQCYEQDPSKIVSYTMQRDASLRAEDHVKIALDTFLNGRTGYVFAVNPNGARYDALIEREGESENAQWDGIWEASARVNDEGWSAEISIPVKTLRFGTGLTRWGFNAERRIQRLQETDRWASPIRNFKVTHMSQGGLLTAIPVFQQGMGLTIRPYALGNHTRNGPDVSSLDKIEAGLDILRNFGSNVTGLLSVNTDFAETEVDTRRVNLTRFPLFFPEKRTFFLEGADIFEFGIGLRGLRQNDIVPFFSRRIGLIQGQSVPLDLAVKATGSVGRFNFGILDTLMRPVDGLAPRTNLFAARGFQNIWSESKFGFLVTRGDPLGRSDSWLVGSDFTYKTTRFQGNKNFLIGVWGLLNQREGLQGDRSALGFKIDFPNDLWDTALKIKRIGDAFDPSLGFVRWAGIYKFDYGLIYKPRPDWSWLRYMNNELLISAVTDLNGTPFRWRVFTAPLNWRLESGDRIEFNIVPQMERLPNTFYITPEVFVPPGKYHWTRYRLEFDSADKRRLKTKIGWWFGKFYNGHMHQLQADLTWRPSHHLNLSLQGEWDPGRLPSGSTDIKLGRTRVNLFFSPNFQVISFVQYDNITRSLGLNTRLRWTYRSLLDIFVVYNRNWFETDGIFRPQLNQFLIKIQYAWRP